MQNNLVVGKADSPSSSLRSGRFFPAQLHFKRSPEIKEKTDDRPNIDHCAWNSCIGD